MSEALRFPVFRDQRGNRFVFPSLYKGGDGVLATSLWSRCRQICAALNVTEEHDTLDVVPEGNSLVFPHVPASAGSSGFAHGSGRVWLIGGPEFDSAASKDPTP